VAQLLISNMKEDLMKEEGDFYHRFLTENIKVQVYLPNPPTSVNSNQDIILHIPVVHQWQETRNGVEAVRLQKRMLGTRPKTGVAPVDLFLDLFGHGAVLLLQQMPGASHHTQPFCDRDFLIA
jgi:hypothetical protein